MIRQDTLAARRALDTEMDRWISAAIKRNRGVAYHGIHDEGSFTFSWDAAFLATGRSTYGSSCGGFGTSSPSG